MIKVAVCQRKRKVILACSGATVQHFPISSVKLSQKEIEKIADFLKTTTGVQPKVAYPILLVPTKDTPLPKLD